MNRYEPACKIIKIAENERVHNWKEQEIRFQSRGFDGLVWKILLRKGQNFNRIFQETGKRGIIKVTHLPGLEPRIQGSGVPAKENAWKIEEIIKSMHIIQDSY